MDYHSSAVYLWTNFPHAEISEEERRLTLEEFRNWHFQFASNPDLATFPTNLSILSGHLENEAAKLQD
jgi:hypothetical protein